MATVLSLLPLLVAAGVLAPGFIQVMAQPSVEGDEAVGSTTALDFPKGVFLGRVPMLPVPRDFSAGFVPELMDLEHLFARKDMVADPAARLFARLLTFPRSHGDVVVINTPDRGLPDIVFKDPDVLAQQSDIWPPPSPDILPLWPLIPTSDGLTIDEPIGPFTNGPFVPEPGSAGLVFAGIAALAMRRRGRRERAGSAGR